MTSRLPSTVPVRVRAPLPVAALLALVLAGPAAAATPRITIAPVKGDRGGEIGAQLVATLCTPNRCIPGALDGPGPRLKRAKKKGVEAAVFGAVGRGRGGRELTVSLVSTGGRTLQRWRLPFGRSRRVPADLLDLLADEVRGILRPGAQRSPAPRVEPPSPAPLATPAPASEPPPGSAAAPGGSDGRRAIVEAATPPPREPQPMDVIVVPRARLEPVEPPLGPPAPPAARADPGAPLAPLLAAEAGLETARRSLKFPSGAAPVGYVVNVAAAPWMRLELHPLRGLGEPFRGAGVFAEGAYLAGIPVAAGADRYQATFLRLRGGAHAHFRAAGLVLRPAVAWDLERFWMRSRDGARYPGLPDSMLGGPSLGLDAALPVGGRLTFLAGGRAVFWLDAKELAGGAAFFPGGSAFGLEAEVGAAIRLYGPHALRLVGRYATTSWSLAADPSNAYAVRSARASELGARICLRLEL